jgi:outer membrane protein assembly factor BamD (BamD/ComL family)
LKTSKNQEQRVIYLLELADCYFEYGDYKKAEFTYGEFKNLYAGHDAVAYSAYREILSAWKNTSDPDRDQTQTEKTLILSSEFLQLPTFAKYHDVVGRVQTMCYEKLVESELRICKFYRDNGQNKAVNIRIAHMQEKWGDGFFQLEQHIAMFEQNGTTQLCLAHNATEKTDMMTRF